MAYSSAHVLYQWGGAMPGGEQWSIGLRTAGFTPTLADLTILGTFASAWWTQLWALSASPRVFNVAGVTRDYCTVRSINADGTTNQQVTVNPTTPDVGVLSNQNLPDQCALVVSLLTARSGRSFRGRSYLPITGAGALIAGKVDPSNVATPAVQFMQALILGLNGSSVVVPTPTSTQLTGAPRIAIQSKTSGQPAAPVNTVRVGDVIDTQRRRRDKLVETYITRDTSNM